MSSCSVVLREAVAIRGSIRFSCGVSDKLENTVKQAVVFQLRYIPEFFWENCRKPQRVSVKVVDPEYYCVNLCRL